MRRHFPRVAAATFLAITGWFGAAGAAQQDAPAQHVPNVVPPPPAEEPAEIAARIDAAAKALAAKEKSASDVLTDPALLTAHEFPRFRALIEKHAPTGKITLSAQDEPGTRLLVQGRVLDGDGHPIAGALVYAYHTDHRGWYSHRGPHVGGNSGDVRHARLFGYVRTDADGKFELDTIRPEGYPRSDLPQHIHIHFDAKGFRPTGSEILFDDDPRLTPRMRERGAEQDALITKPERTAEATERVTCEFTMTKA
jgi:protocatechuate 3,4-dioxygenase beta subunit